MKKQWLIALGIVLVAGIGGFIRLAWASDDPSERLQPHRPTAGRKTFKTRNRPDSGELRTLDDSNRPGTTLPLERTDVAVEISGFLARTTVTQTFSNPNTSPIEAVYTFPLSQNGAVDAMTMRIGPRNIRGEIKRRSEAREIYEAARQAGNTASLLDQERPNIFTQSVANIPPGEKVKVVLSYVETIAYEDGQYEYVFPMVVGPRYNPAGVADAERIPTQTPPQTRAGSDISISVALDSGVPLYGVDSPTHDIDTASRTNTGAAVRLRSEGEIPNQDFILRYGVAGEAIADTIFEHYDARGGFFSFVLQPPAKVTDDVATPKELVFVLDTSGSMRGFPIEKAKACMALALGDLRPRDTFNLITFAGDTRILFSKPVPATAENLAVARAFLNDQRGGGGTEMMTAIRAALEPSDASDHLRIVCFMTDGFVGNDQEIIQEVKRHPNARVFSFGIGGSVNRFLLDKLAEAGRGEVEYVGLGDDGDAAAQRFYERVHTPLLTDISIDWGGLPVTDVLPSRLPDLFSVKPLVVSGRFTKAAEGVVTVRGRQAGKPFERKLRVALTDRENRHDVLSTLWARKKIDDLLVNPDTAAGDLEGSITRLGLDFRLMTNYTSFVAVDENGRDTREETAIRRAKPESEEATTRNAKQQVATGVLGGVYGGVPGGIPGGVPGGVVGGTGNAAPPPLPPSTTTATDSARLAEAPVPTGPVRKSEGALRGASTRRITPEYPVVAKNTGTQGDVVVEVLIHEGGAVISARAVSGPALLQKAAADAARKWEFKPTMLNGVPVKTAGAITFRFNLGGFGAAGISTSGSALASEIDDFISGRTTATPGFVDGEWLLVVVVFDRLSPETVRQLKTLGFEISRTDEKSATVSGRIPRSKVQTLATWRNVRFIAPGKR